MAILNHVGLTVANLEQSIEFYSKIVGFDAPPEEWVFTIEGEWLSKMVKQEEAVAKVAFLPISDGVVLELLEYQNAGRETENTRPNRDAGAMHVAITVPDTWAFYEKFKEQVSFNSEPQVVPSGPWAGNIVAYLTDPDGTSVEIVENVA